MKTKGMFHITVFKQDALTVSRRNDGGQKRPLSMGQWRQRSPALFNLAFCFTKYIGIDLPHSALKQQCPITDQSLTFAHRVQTL